MRPKKLCTEGAVPLGLGGEDLACSTYTTAGVQSPQVVVNEIIILKT